MLSAVIVVIALIVLIDAIKLLVEVLSKPSEYEYVFEPSLVTVIIPSYNGRGTILKTLETTKNIFSQRQILVANDGSTDGTSEIVESKFPEVRVINLPHGGKTKAIREALKYVKTPYVLLLDDDAIISKDFRCPTSLMNSECSAVAFNVVPIKKSVLISLQKHEYAKAMQIGRKFQNKTKSVMCISGAAGFFFTNRLKKILKLHSNIFQGEDLENTLLELILNGKVIFVEETVYTLVPENLMDLAKQRIKSWWPGLYRNLPLLIKIFLRPDTSWRLRWNIAYEVYNCFFAPLKLFSLVVVVINQLWLILGVLYLFYLFLEIVGYIKVRSSLSPYTPLVLLIYPLYGLLQMIFYNGGLLFFIWKLNPVFKK